MSANVIHPARPQKNPWALATPSKSPYQFVVKPVNIRY